MNHKLIATAIAALLAVSGTALAAPADDIKSLLEAHKATEAYQLGKENAGEMGNPMFDFFFGIAAIDSGHAGEGVLALERYLLNFPDNRSARFQLARGYFVLGEDQRARDEFSDLLTDATGSEKSAIERYLDTIRSRESRYLPTATAFVEAGLGYDSNVNSGVRNNDLGILGVISNTSTAIRDQDFFATLSGGAQGTLPLSPGIAAFGSIAGDTRIHFKNENNIFGVDNLGGQAGLSLLSNRSLYRAFLGHAMMRSDQQKYLTTTSLGADWQYQYDELNRFTLGAQYAELRYSDTRVVIDRNLPPVNSANTVRDSNYTGLSVGWNRIFALPMRPTLFVGASYGEERNRGEINGVSNNRALKDLHSRDITGIRIGTSLVPWPQWGASVSYFHQESAYQGPWAGTTDDRKDRYDAIDASLSYYYSRNITLKGELLIAEQRSNFELAKYDRHVLGFKIRYAFK